MAATELATAYLSLVPSMQGAQGQIASALAPVAAEGDRAGAATGNRFMQAMGSPLGKMGALMAGAFAFDKLKDGLVGLYNIGATFDSVADTIRTQTGASGEALEGLVDIAKDVGTSVPTSFEAAGSTVSSLNQRLGLSGDTLSTVAQQYIQAGNILGEAVDIETTTAAFNAFHIEGAAVEGAMDSLFRVSQATGVGMNDLASTVQSSAAPMQNLGFSFEEVAGLAGTLGKAGLNTNQVMASMSKGLVTLAKDGEEPVSAFQRVTSEIGEFVAAGDTASALDLASEIFGTRGASQFVGAIQSGVVNMEDLASVAGMTGDTILGVGQETADAAESWQLIKNKATEALEPIGNMLFDGVGSGLAFVAANMDGPIGGMQRFADGIAGVSDILFRGDFTGPIFGLEEDSAFVDFLFDIRDAAAPLASQLVDLWMAASPLSIAFQVLSPFLPQLAAMFGELASVLGGALSSILSSVIPLVVELAGVATQLLSGVLAAVLPVLANLLLTVAGVLIQLWPVVAVVATTLLGLATTILSMLAPILTTLVSTLLPPLAELFGLLVAAILPLVLMLAEMLIPVINALMPVVVTVFAVIVEIISAAMDIVLGVIQVVTGLLTGNWQMVWDGIGNILSGAWALIVSVVTGAVQIVWSVIQAAIAIILAGWSNGWAMIGSILSAAGAAIINVVTTAFTAVWNLATQIFNNVVGFVAGIPGRVLAGLAALAGLAGEALGWFGGVLNAGRDKLGELTSWVGGLPGRILSALGDMGRLLYDAGKDVVNGMINGIKDMVGNLGRAAADMAKGALNAAKNAIGIESPSKSFRFEVGRMAGEGYALGLEDMQDRADAAASALTAVPAAPAFASPSALALYAAAATYPAGGGAARGGRDIPPLTIEGNVYGATPEEIVDELNTTWTRGAVTHGLRAIGAGV